MGLFYFTSVGRKLNAFTTLRSSFMPIVGAHNNNMHPISEKKVVFSYVYEGHYMTLNCGMEFRKHMKTCYRKYTDSASTIVNDLRGEYGHVSALRTPTF